MTTFDERENAFEAKFILDSELQFKAEARRNKLIGLWAADLLGIVRLSRKLLKQGHTISDTAQECGFHDQSQRAIAR